MNKQLAILFFVVLIAAAYGCLCPRSYMPVCDNQGTTHSNLCTFKCAAEKMLRSGIELRVVKSGECDDSTDNEVPPVEEVFM